MAQPRIRIYQESNLAAPSDQGPCSSDHRVTVALGEIVHLLAEAAQSGRAWLEDFADDEVTISSDLYEVLLAYEHYRQ